MTVEWHDKALDALADIWVAIDAAERGLYEQTARDINQRPARGRSSRTRRGPRE